VSRSPAPARLASLVLAADRELHAAGVDGAVLRVGPLAPAGSPLAWFPLEGAHPLDVLLGFTAPAHWPALGVSCAGRGRVLAGGGPPTGPAARPVAEPVRVTVLLDRAGAAAGVVRRGDRTTPLADPPQGTVADACRRALGLPTAPPPPSTLGLWTLVWLDRLVERAATGPGTAPGSWPEVARLHPAAGPAGGHHPGGVPDPAGLAAAAAALAEAWPWHRLRAEPTLADVPGPPVPEALAAWMDDGMWARWLLARLPARADLLAAVHALLRPDLAAAVAAVAGAAWPEVAG